MKPLRVHKLPGWVWWVVGAKGLCAASVPWIREIHPDFAEQLGLQLDLKDTVKDILDTFGRYIPRSSKCLITKHFRKFKCIDRTAARVN